VGEDLRAPPLEPSALVGSAPPESMAPVEIGTDGGRSSIEVTVPVAPSVGLRGGLGPNSWSDGKRARTAASMLLLQL
jgi:hypothetical protein